MVTFSRRGVHTSVVETLGQQIVAGEHPPGTVFDLDRLESDLVVSRTSLREALRVLSAKGLVDAKPRHGTFVTARQAWNALDSDVIRWSTADTDDADTFAALNEVRQIFEPSVARLAAQRHTEDDLLILDGAMSRLEASAGTSADDAEHHARADIDFHVALLNAAHNALLAQLAPVLEASLQTRDTFVARHHHATDDAAFVSTHAAVLDAVRRGNGELAERRMRRLLASAAEDVEAALAARSTGAK